MASHPRKAVPGAIHGRRRALSVERAGEVYELTAAGWTMRDMATELGVSPRALYYSQRRCSEFSEALEQGRAEYARCVAAAEARRVAEAAEQTRRAAQEAMELLGFAPPPPVARSSQHLVTLPPAARPAQQASAPASAQRDDDSANCGEALPLDDPLGPLDEALPLDDPLGR